MPYSHGCRDCGGELVEDDGTPCCPRCRKERNEAAAELREYRREHGQCLTCGEPVARTKLAPTGGALPQNRRVRQPARYCAAHLAYYAARQRR